MTFEQLLDDQTPALRARLRRMLGDAHAADDVCQDVLLRAWRSAPRDAAAPVVRAWLHQTATNAAIDELRRRTRGRRLGLAAAAAAAEPRTTAFDLADGLAVREALATLPVADRLVL
ncbi:MAG: RNA polymerase sigma factor, partial [Solirubrobacterales bacterium]|nr:RNA polymerase sigma factor [Solirubrobacterales bacterium]